MNPKNDLGETPTEERDREKRTKREREMVCTGTRKRWSESGEKRWTTNVGNVGRKRKGIRESEGEKESEEEGRSN